jgi:hypothetical protein
VGSGSFADHAIALNQASIFQSVGGVSWPVLAATGALFPGIEQRRAILVTSGTSHAQPRLSHFAACTSFKALVAVACALHLPQAPPACAAYPHST